MGHQLPWSFPFKNVPMHGAIGVTCTGHVWSKRSVIACLTEETLRNLRYRPSKLSQHDFHWTVRTIGQYDPSIYKAPKGEMPRKRFPQALIIGAGKCGTRALIEFLNMHPQVVAAREEIHFFDLDQNFRRGLAWYLQRMRYSYSDQITLEKTPSYMWTKRARDEIYKLNRDMKLIVVLKDPVIRLVSQAIRNKDKDVTGCLLVHAPNGTLLVRDNIRPVYWSIYVNYIAKWLWKFPITQLHVLDSSMLVKDPVGEVQKIERFLGIKPILSKGNFHFDEQKGFYCKRPFYVQNVVCLGNEKGKPHPTLSPEVKELLYKFYRPYNEKLFKVIGTRFAWWPSG
ncbi:hypothetical protein EGW08_000191 [Elysia chlorotica]|uniref:Sulfotransferase domain-containing protein n=1 Tax=Elysia chlorotica TaxID=188477 RepID=A0A3S1I4F0_ELYCH|nr:hypothetical protein EGW08_000191 [Elysia chlorotica]